MIRSSRRMGLCLTWLAVNLAFIWGNSLLPGELSAAFSNWVGTVLARIIPFQPPVSSGSGLLRKLAHFTEFCSLGLCLAWLAGMLGKPKFWAFLGGVLVACIDEGIQMFVPDRGPGIRDVLIDSTGVLTGIIVLCFGYHFLKKRRISNNLEEK